MRPAALIFDVFGTLVDWRSAIARQVAAAFAAKGQDIDAFAFADLWRANYDPAMAPIREDIRDYTPLDNLHFETLAYVLAEFDAHRLFNFAEHSQLSRAWEHLDPWPDVGPALAELRQRALLAPCSNGSIALMSRLARHAGFHWDCILGADIARNYKPHPSVYLASCATLRLHPEQVMMVACHNSDLTGAAACGLQTAFFARPTEHGPIHETGRQSDLAPTHSWTVIADDLGDLAAKLTKAA